MADKEKIAGLTRKEFLALPMEERRRILKEVMPLQLISCISLGVCRHSTCCVKTRQDQRDADLKVLEAERKKWADWLEANNVIGLVPGQSSNLGLMLTAEKHQWLIAELHGEKGG